MSLALAPEPPAPPWRTGASVAYTRFELFAGGTPLGVTFDGGDADYLALVRIAPGLMHRNAAGSVLLASVFYELSTVSWWAVGARAQFRWRRWGPSLAVSTSEAGFGVAVGACWGLVCLEGQDRRAAADHELAVALTFDFPVLAMLEAPTPGKRR